jgi:hypothetical protein
MRGVRNRNGERSSAEYCTNKKRKKSPKKILKKKRKRIDVKRLKVGKLCKEKECGTGRGENKSKGLKAGTLGNQKERGTERRREYKYKG